MALAPVSFFNFFETYPIVRKTASQVGILSPQTEKIIQATSSEVVLGKSGQIIVAGNSWLVEIAKNEEERVRGLSNRKVLRIKNGLLFVFDKMSNQSFWMKDMLIPIDMIFLDDNWRIVLIESNLQPNSFPKIFGNGVKSQYVLEINALESEIYGLKVGDQAIFLNK
jgi:uncharacterized membrane protein (UPF0127 family)